MCIYVTTARSSSYCKVSAHIISADLAQRNNTVQVPAYGGAAVPFNSVAQAAARDGNMLIVSVFDQQLLSAVQKAISSASLGLNPIVEGSFLRIPIPKVTVEARSAIADRVAVIGEGIFSLPARL
jgi:ribosome recycling factor